MHSHLPWCGPFLLVTLATAQSNHATTPPDERQSTMGRVVDVLGEPIPAALVEVIVDGRIAQVAHTDGEGIYLIPKMPRDVTHLQISADGKASTLLPWRGVLTPAVQADTGWIDSDGHHWVVSASRRYDNAAAFFRLVEQSDQGGGTLSYLRDPHNYLCLEQVDALGNRVVSTPDYQVLAASSVTDANGNRALVV